MPRAAPVTYLDDDRVLHADTCEPLRAAETRGEVALHALARENYPGEALPDGALAGVRSVGFWDARGDQSWGLDWHRNEGIELTYVARGRLGFAVDGRRMKLEPGHLTVTRPWQRHRVGLPHVASSRLHWLILDVGVRRPNQTWRWPDWCVLSGDDLRRLTELLKYNEQPLWSASPAVRQCFEKLGVGIVEREVATRETRVRIAINELLLSLLEMLEREDIPLDHGLTSSRRSVELFLEALPHRAGAPWTLASMADACALGRSQFASYCKQLTNMTPIAYLNRCRIDRAKRLLATTNRSVTEIAFAAGFDSSQYFATSFRRHTGRTPMSYRRDRVG